MTRYEALGVGLALLLGLVVLLVLTALPAAEPGPTSVRACPRPDGIIATVIGECP